MYRNLAPDALGLAGCPLNEIVELALTHRFGGLEVDFEEFHRQVQARGIASAKRYLASAPLKVSSLRLPIHWDGDEAEYTSEIERLKEMLPTAKELGCGLFHTQILPGSDSRVYHQNFEFHCRRIAQLAEFLGQSEMTLGLAISALPSDQATYQQPFLNTFEGLATLIRMISATNIQAILDTWHWAIGGGTLEQIRQLGPERIGDIRLADLPVEDKDPTLLTESDRLLPGDPSRIDFPAILGLLMELGYTGPVTPAPHPSQLAGKRRDMLVKLAAHSIDDLMKRSGIDLGRRPTAVSSR